MASKRRTGAESSEIRARLVDAASELVREEGCNAVTARRLAEKVHLKRQIVHYYFGTMDELFIAVIQRDGERVRDGLRAALMSDEPLRVIWEKGNNAGGAIYEFTAMALRSEVIRAEVRRYIEEFRRLLAQAVVLHLELRGIKPVTAPVAATIVTTAVSQALALERALGVEAGHAETRALVESWLETFAERGELAAAGGESRAAPSA